MEGQSYTPTHVCTRTAASKRRPRKCVTVFLKELKMHFQVLFWSLGTLLHLTFHPTSRVCVCVCALLQYVTVHLIHIRIRAQQCG